ncbi:MAG: tetratricopeptide repeat protein [Sphingomicrobium sp.]
MTLLIAALLAAAAPNLNCPTEATAEAAACRAVAADKAGNYAGAAQAFEDSAAKSAPGDPSADRALAAAGNMWIAANQPGKAAVALDRALAGTGLLADQRGLALLDRARAAEAQGDLKTARTKLTLAAETISEDPFLWYFSAALAIRENDPTTAKVAINRALTMIPNDPTVLFEAGHVFHFAGEETKAREYWTKALAADPGGPSGQAAKRALAMLDVPLTVTGAVTTQPNFAGEKKKD